MLVVNRFYLQQAGFEDQASFQEQAQAALKALAEQKGFRKGTLTRAYDDPEYWCLVTEWESVGAYRRALGAFDVKVTATPLLARSVDEPSAYEELAVAAPGAELKTLASDRAVDDARGRDPAG
jgi:hypothetical protein